MNRNRFFAVAITAGAVACLACQTAFAQANSLFGSSGPTTGGRTTAPASSASALGTSALGTQGLTGGRTTGSQTGLTSLTGQTTGNTGFVGRGNATGGFVGQQNAGQTTGGRNTQTSTFRGVNRTTTARGTTANTNRGGQFGGGFAGAGQQGLQTRDAIRPVTVLGFDYPRQTVATVNTVVAARFARITARTPQLQSVSATLSGDYEVVLTGTVDSESTRKLAENLARLEPGVRRIRNELVVQK